MENFRRREVLRFAAMTGAAVCAEQYALAASDFWNKEKPAEWTDQQKEEIRTKSPWAKKVDAEMAGGGGGARSGGSGGGGGGSRKGGGGGGDTGDSGDSPSGGSSRPSRTGGGGNSVAPAGNAGGTPAPSLEILWMSAKPIQDAHPLTFGAKLENHYVIAVTGIPQQILNAAMMGRGGRSGAGQDQANAGSTPAPADPTAGLKRGATLIVKGKDPQGSDVVMSMNNNATVLFGFAKDSLPLTVADKEVEFDLKLGGMSAKVKFALKDMMYNGELAL
jgi:hypothetical protein